MAIVWLLIWGACALVFGYFTATVSLKAGALVALGLLIGAGLLTMVVDIVLGLGSRR